MTRKKNMTCTTDRPCHPTDRPCHSTNRPCDSTDKVCYLPPKSCISLVREILETQCLASNSIHPAKKNVH